MGTSTPEPDDIIIQSVPHEGGVAYGLRAASGPGQYLVHSRNEAVSQAVQFAKRLGVRAWLTDDGITFVWLDDGDATTVARKRRRP